VQRSAYFDNAKFILIFFVVFGHIIQSFMSEHEIINQMYLFIYSFHMPAFILISGFFAKGIYEKDYIKKLCKKLLLPYAIFQLIYTIFYFFLFDQSTFTLDLFNPQWSLWFLISLFFWNMMVIAFKKLPKLVSLALAFGFGLAVGYIDFINDYLSLSRTFVFFPFFLLGYFLSTEHFKKIRSTPVRLIAFIVIISSCLLVYFFPNINETWFFGSKPYNHMESLYSVALLKRVGVYCINLAMITCFFAFIPNRQFFFTDWGKNTLYVYLLHGFFVRLLRVSGIESYFDSFEALIILVIASGLLTCLLSSHFIVTCTQPIIELSTSKVKQLKNRLQLTQ